jgi:hypothetical protein
MWIVRFGVLLRRLCTLTAAVATAHYHYYYYRYYSSRYSHVDLSYIHI